MPHPSRTNFSIPQGAHCLVLFCPVLPLVHFFKRFMGQSSPTQLEPVCHCRVVAIGDGYIELDRELPFDSE